MMMVDSTIHPVQFVCVEWTNSFKSLLVSLGCLQSSPRSNLSGHGQVSCENVVCGDLL